MDIESRLEKLKGSGDIKDWKIEDIDVDGNMGYQNIGRNTQRLTIILPLDKELVIETFCSGCSEDTCFI